MITAAGTDPSRRARPRPAGRPSSATAGGGARTPATRTTCVCSRMRSRNRTDAAATSTYAVTTIARTTWRSTWSTVRELAGDQHERPAATDATMVAIAAYGRAEALGARWRGGRAADRSTPSE